MSDFRFMRLALRLAQRGYGATSPNPMVGAILVKDGKIIGRGWHRCAGLPHAEIEALRDAAKRGHNVRGATLYVTLEPCSTRGRTPPCTEAIIAAGIRRIVAGTVDPNPKHAGRGFKILKRSGIEVFSFDEGKPRRAVGTGLNPRQQARADAAWLELAGRCSRLNEAFNHWIIHRTPFVTVKAAMTLDGKIATASGESAWITGEKARAYGMKLRKGSDAILVGVNTVLADDPSLTFRPRKTNGRKQREGKRLRRLVLDSMARTPVTANVVRDQYARLTTIVVTRRAPVSRVRKLEEFVNVWVAPEARSRSRSLPSAIDVRWLLKKLGSENVTSLLVEGGGEVNASFLFGGHVQRVAFFYAPKILGGREARKSVAGEGVERLADAIQLREVAWRHFGEDLVMHALVQARQLRSSRQART